MTARPKSLFNQTAIGHTRLRILRLLITLIIPVAFCNAPANAQPDLEYQVKAVFLFHFTRFIDWPEEAFREAGAPFVIGVLSPENPFNGALDRAVSEKTVNGRSLYVRHDRTLEALGDAHILYIWDVQKGKLVDILERVKDQPVLTVGEAPEFTAVGGMVRFFLREGRIAFEINHDAIKRAGLNVSSRLLALADIYPD